MWCPAMPRGVTVHLPVAVAVVPLPLAAGAVMIGEKIP